jgi:DNA-binding MarR family transcriptional regulator
MTSQPLVAGGSPASGSAMWNAVLSLHADVEHRLATALRRRHGLGLPEFRALAHLADAPRNGLRMQELADRTNLNQSSVTRLVSRLNAAGFTCRTYRDVCEDDERGVYPVLADLGRTRSAEALIIYDRTPGEALPEAAEPSPAHAALVAALGESMPAV